MAKELVDCITQEQRSKLSHGLQTTLELANGLYLILNMRQQR